MKGKPAVYTKKYKALHKQECVFLFFRKAIKLNKIKSNLISIIFVNQNHPFNRIISFVKFTENFQKVLCNVFVADHFAFVSRTVQRLAQRMYISKVTYRNSTVVFVSFALYLRENSAFFVEFFDIKAAFFCWFCFFLRNRACCKCSCTYYDKNCQKCCIFSFHKEKDKLLLVTSQVSPWTWIKFLDFFLFMDGTVLPDWLCAATAFASGRFFTKASASPCFNPA